MKCWVCECEGQSVLQVDAATSIQIAARMDEVVRKHRDGKASDESVHERQETAESPLAPQAGVRERRRGSEEMQAVVREVAI